ncbi:MAG: hypothetical protein IJ548_02450 [Paludibacteraceae bacterium]|nr:hypothetical protein [Paludibacteraceae bacterium]MBQ8705147.1 hypothetical protein [Paludibacteraceae bacterium]
MKENAITFETLCARLERAIHADVGMHGLDILITGWIRKRNTVTRETLRQRKKADGEPWLSYYEALSFSRYAGYDLT